MPVLTRFVDDEDTNPFGSINELTPSPRERQLARTSALSDALENTSPALLDIAVRRAFFDLTEPTLMTPQRAQEVAAERGVPNIRGIGENGISARGLELLIDRQVRKQQREQLIALGEIGGLERLGLGVVSSAPDPINLLPFGAGARSATLGGAVVRGAAAGAAVTAAAEPAYFALSRFAGDDYTLMDSLVNVGAGGVLGAGFGGFGKIIAGADRAAAAAADNADVSVAFAGEGVAPVGVVLQPDGSYATFSFDRGNFPDIASFSDVAFIRATVGANGDVSGLSVFDRAAPEDGVLPLQEQLGLRTPNAPAEAPRLEPTQQGEFALDGRATAGDGIQTELDLPQRPDALRLQEINELGLPAPQRPIVDAEFTPVRPNPRLSAPQAAQALEFAGDAQFTPDFALVGRPQTPGAVALLDALGSRALIRADAPNFILRDQFALTRFEGPPAPPDVGLDPMSAFVPEKLLLLPAPRLDDGRALTQTVLDLAQTNYTQRFFEFDGPADTRSLSDIYTADARFDTARQAEFDLERQGGLFDTGVEGFRKPLTGKLAEIFNGERAGRFSMEVRTAAGTRRFRVLTEVTEGGVDLTVAPESGVIDPRDVAALTKTFQQAFPSARSIRIVNVQAPATEEGARTDRRGPAATEPLVNKALEEVETDDHVSPVRRTQKEVVDATDELLNEDLAALPDDLRESVKRELADIDAAGAKDDEMLQVVKAALHCVLTKGV